MDIEQPVLWVCKSCWKMMPRTEVEKLTLNRGQITVPALKCSSCNAIGQFVPESSPEFADFANDLAFEVYTGKLREAGYESLEYSAQCDSGNHNLCAGKNRLPGEIPVSSERCFCRCHELSNRSGNKSLSWDDSLSASQAAGMSGRRGNRIPERDIAKIVQCIATPPNRRSQPKPGDLNGSFDFWFDGGGARQVTGWTEYELADGIRAKVDAIPSLSITIDFPNGSRVTIRQQR